MTFIGKHLPELVPFMEDTYTPQAVNQARSSFKKKVRKASATFFYGAMCGFFTTDELDDLLFEASEVARFLLEVEGTTLDIDEEIDIEDRITKVMRSVGEAAKTILRTRGDESEQDDSAVYGEKRDPNIVAVSPGEAPTNPVHEESVGDSVNPPSIFPIPLNSTTEDSVDGENEKSGVQPQLAPGSPPTGLIIDENTRDAVGTDPVGPGENPEAGISPGYEHQKTRPLAGKPGDGDL